MSNHLGPTTVGERIHSLDLLRGFALLGILIMNIVSFGHIGTAYINPNIGPGLEGYNGAVYAFSHIFADMRFMGLFSLLFGAGLVLFSERAIIKGHKPGKYHYRRMFFLLIFGLLHAYLIWMGDILVTYALCGSLIFLIRKWKIKNLLILGSFLWLLPITLGTLTYLASSPEDQERVFSFFYPEEVEIQKEIAGYRGSYMQQMPFRIQGAIELQTFVFLYEQVWRACGMMILGIILYRTGVLTRKKSRAFYIRSIIIGFGVGILLSSIGYYRSFQNEWNGAWVMNVGHSYNYLASVFMVMGYVGLFLLWSASSSFRWIKNKTEAVGRMAFTNYILTSVLCTFVFYGHGLGLFGSLDRLEMWGVILAVWIILLIFSDQVLKRYKQGPLEHLWRKLTYRI
ncbi:MAG: DUF418 domain-containing protein [Flavobacteriales bacterium]|nr:DUF418 domain-containing protein [Flavobacteriales bacterium]